MAFLWPLPSHNRPKTYSGLVIGGSIDFEVQLGALPGMLCLAGPRCLWSNWPNQVTRPSRPVIYSIYQSIYTHIYKFILDICGKWYTLTHVIYIYVFVIYVYLYIYCTYVCVQYEDLQLGAKPAIRVQTDFGHRQTGRPPKGSPGRIATHCYCFPISFRKNRCLNITKYMITNDKYIYICIL